MIRKGLYILFFFIAAIHSYSQYSDLKFYGLKGKVKSITSRGYTSAKLLISGWKPDEDSLLVTRQYYFNPQGLLDSLVTHTGISDKSFRYVTEYIYNNGRLSTLKQRTSNDDKIYTLDVIWMDSLKVKTTSASEYGYRSESIEYLSENYRSIGNVFKSYQDDSLTAHIETLNFYNEENLLVMAMEKNMLKNTQEITNYQHEALDKLKNFTVTILSDERGVFNMLYVRTIEYY